MVTKEHIKIIVSAVIVIVLVSMGIYAFIFRNELSQKIQEISKKNEDQQMKTDRIILPQSTLKDSPEIKKDATKKNDLIADKSDPMKIKNLPEDISNKNTDTILQKKTEMLYDENLVPNKEKNTMKEETSLRENKQNSSIKKKKTNRKKKIKSNVHRKNKQSNTLEKRVSKLERKMGLTMKKEISLEKRIKRLEKVSVKKRKKKKSRY